MLRAAFLARVYHFRVPFAIASETLPLYKGMFRHFIIDGLHTLLRKRTGILDFLSALAVRPTVKDSRAVRTASGILGPSDSQGPLAPLPH